MARVAPDAARVVCAVVVAVMLLTGMFKEDEREMLQWPLAAIRRVESTLRGHG